MHTNHAMHTTDDRTHRHRFVSFRSMRQHNDGSSVLPARRHSTDGAITSLCSFTTHGNEEEEDECLDWSNVMSYTNHPLEN